MRRLHNIPQETDYPQYLWVVNGRHENCISDDGDYHGSHHFCADTLFKLQATSYYCTCTTCAELRQEENTVHYFDERVGLAPGGRTVCPPCEKGIHPRPPQ